MKKPIITITPQRLPAIQKLLDEQGIWVDCPDLMERVEFALGLLGTTADNYANAGIALEDIRQYAETDTYIAKSVAYGLGRARRPTPPMSDRPIQRNSLGEAYQLAEDLLDNARAIAAALDTYSRDGRSADLSRETLDYLNHNILNATGNLERLYLLLRPLAEIAQRRAEMITGDPS